MHVSKEYEDGLFEKLEGAQERPIFTSFVIKILAGSLVPW